MIDNPTVSGFLTIGQLQELSSTFDGLFALIIHIYIYSFIYMILFAQIKVLANFLKLRIQSINQVINVFLYCLYYEVINKIISLQINLMENKKI